MEAITIQIITSVIKETPGENSSELICLRVDWEAGRRRAVWIYTSSMCHAVFSFTGQKAPAIGQHDKFLPIT